MIVYHYSKETLEYITKSDARESPLEKGVFLCPANATFDPVPDENDTYRFVDGEWVVADDNYITQKQWYIINSEKENLISEADELIMNAEDSGDSIYLNHLKNYRNELRNVSQQSDPFYINWPVKYECTCCIINTETCLYMLEKKKQSIIDAGYTDSNGDTWQIRESDIANFDRMRSLIVDLIENPHGGQWRTIDNNFVSKTDEQMKTLAIDASQYRDSVLRAWSIKKDEVSALTDEQASVYDIESGWPANGV